MTLHIQMIGTGSAFAKKFYNNNALVFGNSYKLLIDCGTTAPRALHELKLTPDRLDGILLTHQHADHIGGVEEIAFRLYYTYNRKRIKLFVPDTLETMLWEHSLQGGLINTAEGLSRLSDYFDVIPIQEGVKAAIADDLTVELIRTQHIRDKYSYSLILNDVLFYSGDLVFSPDLLKHVVEERNCKYVFHDCQLSGPGTVHTTLDELLTLPVELQSRIYLMHYGDEVGQYFGRSGKMSFVNQHELYSLA